MILEPINGVDCVAFVIFLAPQLLYQADLVVVLSVVVRVLPFLGMSSAVTQFPHALMHLQSSETTLPASQGTVFHQKGRQVIFYPKRHPLSRYSHTLCSICIWKYSCERGTSFLFQMGCLPLLSISPIEAWLPSQPDVLSGSH